jgi:hypothetical protein
VSHPPSSASGALSLVADRAPDLHHFLPLTEMYERLDRLMEHHPQHVAVSTLGSSRNGTDIRCYTIGHGAQHAVWYAGPHANEPVGGNTILYLAESWCADAALRDALDWTMHLIPCIDPDGYELNSGWLSGPFTTSHYHQSMYRPAMDEWPDWGLPVDQAGLTRDALLPEAQALQRLLDDVQPRFVYSLHNGEIGGGFFYVSKDLVAVGDQLQRLLEEAGLPFESALASFGTPGVEPLQPGVFLTLRTELIFEAIASSGHPDPSSLLTHGDLATCYAERRGSATLLSELPYWSFKALPEQPAGITLQEVVTDTAATVAAFGSWLDGAVRELPAGDDPLYRSLVSAAAFLLQTAAGMEQIAASDPSMGQVATAEEVATYRYMLGIAWPQRHRGTLLRLLNEVEGHEALRRKTSRDFEDADAELSAVLREPFDPGLLAQTQARAGLVAQAQLSL